MNKNDIATLIHFNFWANGRILAACERLTPDEFIRPVTPDPGWGTLHGILVHILDTEFGWRATVQGEDAGVILEAADFPHLAAVKARWDIEKAAWLSYLNGLNDRTLNQGYGDDPYHGPKVWQTIMHVVTHGIQHRSEAAFILTGYGHSPGELDFGIFLRDNSDAP